MEYLWDFGDGTTSYQQNPTHVYSTDGEYLIQLTVKDNEGGTCTANTTCSVISANVGQSTRDYDTIILGGFTVVIITIIILLRPQIQQYMKK